MENRKKKICFVTGNRAEYTRIKTVLDELKKKPDIDFYLVVMGSHLLDSFGKTVNDIVADGYKIDYRIFMELEGRQLGTMAKSVGIATCDLATYFENRRPDLVVVLMDRYENIAVAVAAALMNIPLAHMQGGEVTGTIDESVRHAITKFSHLHFPATEESRERIIKMGERPEAVWNVGDPATDVMLRAPQMTEDETIRELNDKIIKDGKKLDPAKPFILCVQHPVTTEFGGGLDQIRETLLGLQKLNGYNVVFLAPNIDAGGNDLLKGLENFFAETKSPNMVLLKHVPHDLFVNLMRNAKCMVGNSSSGVRETCYFGTPTVNVGTRQQDRERGANVADATYDREKIYQIAVRQIEHGKYAPEFIYGDGNSGARIADILSGIDLSKIEVQKRITY